MRTVSAFLFAVLLAIAVSSFGGTAKAPGGVEFTYYDPSAATVSLAGLFNNWDANAAPMTKDAEGTWRTVVALPPGKYEYKFVVNGGTWMADPDNPKIVGDYGNSEIEIDKDGKPVAAGVVKAISNTLVNARVAIDGWFRGTYSTRKDARPVYGIGTPALADVRWRLSRPAHEMYVSVNPTLGSDVKGSLTMRIDSGVGDIREIRTDLYAGLLAYQKSRFDVLAYYNDEILSLGDPLHALGHIDLPGSFADDAIAFGRGAQGVGGKLRLGGAEFQGSYSNIYDYDIYDSPLRWRYNFETASYDSMPRYDNVGTDVAALRAQRAFGRVTAGVTYLSRRNGWWIPFDGRNTSPEIDAYKAATKDSASFWFELGTSDWLAAGDLAFSPADWISVFGEYGVTSYSARWDAGNRVRKQGDVFVDGEIDVPIGDTEGTMGEVGVEFSAGDNLLSLSYERFHSDAMAAGEGYAAVDALPFEDPDNSLVLDYGPNLLSLTEYRNTYIGVQNIDRFIVYEERPLPERTFGTLALRAATRIGGISVGLDAKTTRREWNHAAGDWPDKEVTWTRLLPSVGAAAFNGRWNMRFADELTWNNLSGRMPTTFDKRDLIADGTVGMWGNWGWYYNFRVVTYDWTEEGVSRDETFTNSHVALVWSPIANVEIRLGYGLNPLYYRDTPVEGRQIGRERYMSSFLWLDPRARSVDAEEALEDLKMISLMGVISF